MNLTPKTENQALYVDCFTTKKVTFGLGPAGTGKTCLAIDYAMGSTYANIVLTRPIVEACGEQMGFLPGKVDLKLGPYVKVFDDFMGSKSPGKGRQVIKLPLAHMRGLTFNDSIIILDEAQNCTYQQLKLILTRLGEKSKIIINGDITQIDIYQSGLAEVASRIADMSEVGIVNFTNSDIVRSKFVRRLMERL